MSRSTPEQWAAMAAPHLSEIDRLRVANAFAQYPQRAAMLMSAMLGGKMVTGEEIAQASLEIAWRLEHEGGQLS